MEQSTNTATAKGGAWRSVAVDASNLLMNGIIAAVTGSVVMLAAALQSLAELSTAALMLFGRKYVNKRPTKLHPFGYGKELYYWSTLSSFVVIAVVGFLAIRFGYQELLDPTKVQHVVVGLVVLVAAMIANMFSFRITAYKMLEGAPFTELPKAFNTSPHIAAKSTLVLDVMGALSSGFGAVCLVLAWASGSTRIDGIGAVGMGVILIAAGVALLFTLRGLVTGQSAPPEMERKIRDAARDVPEVKHVLGMRTMMLGSDKLLVNIEVHLRDGLNTDQVEATVEKVKNVIEEAADGLQVHVEPDAYTDVHTHPGTKSEKPKT
jgi:cation diffusion facilitator family transporter